MYALEIEQLRKTYAGGFEALKGISLQVKKGDFYALLGPNGAGSRPPLASSHRWSIKPPAKSQYLVTISILNWNLPNRSLV